MVKNKIAFSLTSEQKNLRKRVVELTYGFATLHLSSNLAMVDIISAIYKLKKTDEKFVLSNGHSALALYAVLESVGKLKKGEAYKLKLHPDRNLKNGIYVSTGSLGQGLPIAVGFALADREKRVWVTISDGECAEGSIWEALRIAQEERLNNLKIVVNANGWGAYSKIDLIKLKRRFRGFGYKVREVNGHNLGKLHKVLSLREKYGPLLVFARTRVDHLPFLKGQGGHYYKMSNEDYKLALKLLE
jgi:transketolase